MRFIFATGTLCALLAVFPGPTCIASAARFGLASCRCRTASCRASVAQSVASSILVRACGFSCVSYGHNTQIKDNKRGIPVAQATQVPVSWTPKPILHQQSSTFVPLPSSDTFPSGHAEHSEAPAPEYVLAAQRSHAAEPASDLNFPSAHPRQKMPKNSV